MKTVGVVFTFLAVLHTTKRITPSNGFLTSSPPFITTTNTHKKSLSFPILHSSNSDDEVPKKSQILGNTREPSPEEIAIMDEMITKLSNAKPYELPNAVAQAIRVVSSPRFFLRIAERVDTATDPTEKEKLTAFSSNLVSTLEAVMSTAQDKIDETAKTVEKIVKAASEPDSGEFLVPLSKERVDAMKGEMEKVMVDGDQRLDEGFLSTVDAWMNKSHQDGMDGMVGILQKVLQLYAGFEISRSRKSSLGADVGAALSGAGQKDVDSALEGMSSTPANDLFEKLLESDTDMWEYEMKQSFADGLTTPSKLKAEVQGTMETVVLGLENGSMAQRVQAEYLRELVTRIEALEQSL